MKEQRGFIEHILFGPFVFAIVLLIVVHFAEKNEPPPRDSPYVVPEKNEDSKDGAGEVNRTPGLLITKTVPP